MVLKCQIIFDKNGKIQEISGSCKVKDFKKQIKRLKEAFARIKR